MAADPQARTRRRPDLLPGKRVGGACYLHALTVPALPTDAQERVHAAERIAGLGRDDWNVVKLADRENKVSLLRYADFFEDPFPPLAAAWAVDLDVGAARRIAYDLAGDPPILHRKELLLPVDHPARPRHAELTQQLEAHGLFRDSSRIGRRKAWQARLDAAGVRVEDHQLVEKAGAAAGQLTSPPATGAESEVQRHKTAISRSSLSTPLQALARHGFLDDDRRVFDYGCGRGDDLQVFTTAGLDARGWDPHYAPQAPKLEAEIVNLGYVLNVIEEPEERAEALRDAYALARQVLSVAVLTAGRADVSAFTPYRDGFLTSRNTFQKYFAQEEVQTLIAETTGEEAIPAAPGVFFVFKDKIEEQRFLEGRARRRRDISHLLAIQPPPAAPKQTKTDALIAEHRATIEGVWRRALELGRVPAIDEFDEETGRAVEQAGLSVRKALSLAQRIVDAAALTQAREQRVTDLRVYFALNLFNRRRKYRELPAELQRDVRAFFGSHAEAETAGRDLLYGVSDPEAILAACGQAVESGLGHLFEGHSLQLHAELIPRLPEVLRVYVGCAEKLFGVIDGDTADLVKIHAQSGKLTVLRYDDFFGKPLPRLVERVKIKMRERDVDYFDHGDDKRAPRLTMKSRYMAPDQQGYERQRGFDEQLAAANIVDLSGYGPSAADLARAVTRNGYRVVGFSLVPPDSRTD
jgi:DNA phosphorothioation-associated putative methyltransferase